MAKKNLTLDELSGLERLTEKAKRSIVRSFEIAAKLNSNESLPIHLFLAMLEDETSLPANILSKLGLDLESTKSTIEQKVSLAASKNPISPSFGENLKQVINNGFIVAQRLSHVYVGTEHLLVALLGMKDLDFVQELEQVGIDAAKVESTLSSTASYASGVFKDTGKKDSGDGDENSSLDFFASNMNDLAKNGRYLPILGRDDEVTRLVHILSRKTKNNPILVGDAGVGKTAIVEGFVQKIVGQETPTSFLNKTVLNLDISGIIAGSRVRGDVEERVLAIVNDALEAGDKILFIDEIHMIVGAGGSGSGGGMDIANILKPYLTNSDLRVIGATTIDEYRRYFESDAALSRRFQPIMVDEIDPESAVAVMRHLRPAFEEYHKVRITDEAIVDAVKLSRRYIADRFLPDKAIDLIDEAAAKVKIDQEIEVEPELSRLGSRLIQVQKRKDEALSRRDIATAARYLDQEENVTTQIVSVVEGDKSRSSRKRVTSDMIRAIVSSWTKIPLSQEAMNDNLDLSKLEEALTQEVMGQEHAIKNVVGAVKRSHLGITDESRPLGSFLFLGPTGVGKSQLAKSLAQVLFGSEEMLIQIDMSEYMESHSVSKMIGSPPGYVGYQEGGQLTDKIRTRPYSVVLFDEIEKAHPDVLNILLQILNDGHLQDARGRRVSFKNTIVILTSNIGAEDISQDSKLGFDIQIEDVKKDEVEEAFEQMSDQIMESLKEYLRPELLNRIDETIIFRGLNEKDCLWITAKFVNQLKKRLAEQKISLEVDKKVINLINKEGYSKEYGGRNLKRKVQTMLETPLADFMIKNKLTKKHKKDVLVQVELGKDKQLVFKRK